MREVLYLSAGGFSFSGASRMSLVILYFGLRKFPSDHSPCWAGCNITSHPMLSEEKVMTSVAAKVRIFRHCSTNQAHLAE